MAFNSKYERIWKTVNSIPRGRVSSYGQIADFAGLPGRARLVGKSLGYVPNALNVNWHRVVRSNGQLAFTKGSEQALKQTGLLQEEGVAVINNRVKMKAFNWIPDLATMLQDFSH
ncbi:MAG: methylated-DNA-protein-cysteine methyltransferase-like protein [Alphaproteobacteria bacterium]|jgi:methylated-DNA-protein-cysteine methyltransferase-like protein